MDYLPVLTAQAPMIESFKPNSNTIYWFYEIYWINLIKTKNLRKKNFSKIKENLGISLLTIKWMKIPAFRFNFATEEKHVSSRAIRRQIFHVRRRFLCKLRRCNVRKFVRRRSKTTAFQQQPDGQRSKRFLSSNSSSSKSAYIIKSRVTICS